MSWQDDEKALRAADFSDADIKVEYERQRKTLEDAGGFTPDEIDAHFGIKRYDTAKLQEAFTTALNDHFKTQSEVQTKSPTGTVTLPNGVKVASNFWEAVQAGLQLSSAGLVTRGKNPDMVVAEDAPISQRVGGMAAAVIGDLPASIVGSYGGGMGGAALGSFGGPASGVTVPAGAVLGSGFGAMAVPAFIRTYLMDAYEKGEARNFKEFWDRTSLAFLESVKQGGVGAATGGVGKGLGVALPKAMGPISKGLTIGAAELTTMTSLGAAMEGRAPEPKEFLDGAIILAGFKTATMASDKTVNALASRLRKAYVDTGMKPSEMVLQAQKDPALREQLLSDSKKINWDGREVIVEDRLNPAAKPTFQNPFEPLKKEPLSGGKKPPGEAPPSGTGGPPKPPKDVTAAEAKIEERIARETGDAKSEPYSVAKWYTDWVASDFPVQKVVESGKLDVKDIPALENPHILYRTKNGYKGIVEHLLKFGGVDYKTLAKTETPSFNDVLKPIVEQGLEKKFTRYAVAERVLELDKRGIKKGVDIEAAKEVVSAYQKEFRPILDKLVEYNNDGVLKYAYESGLTDKEGYLLMKALGKSYVPLNTIVEDGFGDAKRSRPNSLKRIKGSENKIIDPILSIVNNTETMIRASEINRARTSLVEFAKKNDMLGEGKLIQASDPAIQKITISEKEIAKHLAAQGIEASPEAMEVYRRYQKRPLAENEFEVWEKGKRKVYQTTPEIAEAMKGLDGEPGSTNLLFRLMKGATELKKFGITGTPEFVAKNAFRDRIFSSIFTKGNIGFKDVMAAMKHIIAEDEVYQDFLRSKSNAIFTKFGEDWVQNDLYRKFEEVGVMESVRNQVRSAADRLAFGARLVELAPRVAEFKAVSEGAKSGNKLLEGGFAANEVTLDFSRRGAKMSAFNAITAFMNVQIQGVDRIAREAKEQPQRLITKSFAYITAPSVTLWAINHDEKWYKDLPQWEKDTFWHIELGGKVYRFPKPQELGLFFGSLPERILEAVVEKNPKAFKNIASTILGTLTPNVIPDSIQPFAEQFFNFKTFTETPIVPQTLEKLLPHEQYSAYTSDTAKALGKIIYMIDDNTFNRVTGTMPLSKFGGKEAGLASPLVLENYIRSWGGQYGKYALELTDKLLRDSGTVEDKRPESRLEDYPVIRAFISRYPRADAKPITDFFDNFEKHMPVVESYKKRIQEGDIEGAKAYMAAHPASFQVAEILKGTKKMLTDQSRILQKLNNKKLEGKPVSIWEYANATDEQLDQHELWKQSRAEKKQLMEGVYLRMTDTARRVNEMIYDIERKKKSK